MVYIKTARKVNIVVYIRTTMPEPDGLHWSQRPDIWNALDKLAAKSWPELKNFLDLLSDHQSDLSPIASTLLFGGIGKFLGAYNKARAQDLDGVSAYTVAIETVYEDARIQTLILHAVNNTVDNVAMRAMQNG